MAFWVALLVGLAALALLGVAVRTRGRAPAGPPVYVLVVDADSNRFDVDGSVCTYRYPSTSGTPTFHRAPLGDRFVAYVLRADGVATAPAAFRGVGATVPAAAWGTVLPAAFGCAAAVELTPPLPGACWGGVWRRPLPPPRAAPSADEQADTDRQLLAMLE